jgi:hypothetical protein
MNTLTKTFKGRYTPIDYNDWIEVEVVVDFQNIGTQKELNDILLGGNDYEYKVQSVCGWNFYGEWEDFVYELSGDIIRCRQSEQIDDIISLNIDKEVRDEQARKNG